MTTMRAASKSKRVLRLGLLIGVLAAASGWLMAAAGDLDPTFGSGGAVLTDAPAPYCCESANAVAVQSDGRIIIGGSLFDASNTQAADNDFALARYTPDGVIDPTFGVGGIVTTKFAPNSSDGIRAIAIQSDGRIVAAGNSQLAASEQFALARYLPDGTLDGSFGAGGKVTIGLPSNGVHAYAVAIQPDGRIIVAGAMLDSWFGESDFALARIDSSGSVDPTFGTGGWVTTPFLDQADLSDPFRQPYDVAQSLVIQPDGRIVAAGFSNLWPNFYGDMAVVRYTAAGTLDPTFGTAGNGKVRLDFYGNHDDVTGVALQPDGRILLAGSARNTNAGPRHEFAAARLDPNGVLDPTFGEAGKVTTRIEPLDARGNAMALETDGRFVIAGSYGNDFAVVRYRSNGALDTSFSTDGVATFDRGGYEFAGAVAIQSDGKVVTAGSALPITGGGNLATFLVVRFEGGAGTLEQSITFAPLPDRTFGDPPFAVSATATSGLSVTFTAAGACTINGSRVTITGSGACSITASQDGNGTYAPAPDVTQAFQVLNARTLTVTLAGTGTGHVASTPAGIDCGADCSGTYQDGTTVTLTATPALGSTFAAFGGHADCSDGTVTLTSDVACTATFDRAPTTTTISSSLNPSTFGAPVTFTVTVTGSGPTGSVTVRDGATTLASGLALSAGSASFTLSTLTAATHTITAQYSGDTGNTASTSAPLLQVVDKATPIVTLTSSRNPSAPNEAVTLSGTLAAAATGTVTILDGAASVGVAAVTSGTYALTVASFGLGTHTLTARYEGDDNHLPALSAPLAQVVEVTNNPPEITPVPDQAATWGALLSFPILASDPDGDALIFSLVAPPAGAVITSGGQFSWTPASDQVAVHALTVQVSDGTLTAATSFNVTVRKRGTTVSYLGPGAAASGPVLLSARLTDVSNAPVAGRSIAFLLGTQGASGTTDATGLAAATIVLNQPVGTATVSASFAGDSAHDPSSATLSFRINAAPVISPIAPQSVTWGQTLSFFVDAADPVGGALTFNLLNAPAGVGLVFESSTRRRIVWTPTEAQVGLTAITIGVSDGVTTVSVTVPVEVVRPAPVVDTDGDGIRDEWEINGVDIDGNGSIDLNLPALGANPLRKDIFIEVDWMVKPVTCVWQVCWTNGGVLQPQRAVLDGLIATFATAPVSNPDGSSGITLHVDAGPATVMNPRTGEPWGPWSRAGVVPYDPFLGTSDGINYDWAEFETIKQAFMEPARRAVFHYVVYADRLGGVNASGISRGIPAADFILAAGDPAWNGGLTATQESSLFLHELGHNLSLHHGGGDDINYKPNYSSVLNYMWSLTGLPPDNRATYSNLVEPAVDEAVTGDANGDGRINLLLGYEDWPNLVFTGGGLGDLAPPPAPTITPIDPIDPNELRARGVYARPGDGLLEFKGPSLLAANSGVQSLALDVKNISGADAVYVASAGSALSAGPLTTTITVPAGGMLRAVLPLDTNGLVPGDYVVIFTLRTASGELVHQRSATVVVVDLTVPETQEAARAAAAALAALPPDSGLDPSVKIQIVQMIEMAAASWTAAVQLTGPVAMDAVYRIEEPQIDPVPGRITARSVPGAPLFDLNMVRAGRIAIGIIRLQHSSGEMFEAIIAGSWNESRRIFEGKWFQGKRAGSLVFSLREP
jgi:uncharacterized delta-60 repeat protein